MKTKLQLLVMVVCLIFQSLYAQPTIPDFTPRQTYLGPPPQGTNALYARQFSGGRGEGVTIVDIEFNWNLDHLDLDANTSGPSDEFANHGTSVMGILVAEENGFGITGFAPSAHAHGITANNGDDLTAEIQSAVTYLNNNGQQGDIILIEVQTNGIWDDITYSEMPPEFLPDQFNDADNRGEIKAAVEAGYIVVEVASNGGHNLNINDLLSLMPVNLTGAIMVAAADSNDTQTVSNSNFGDRIDANGWGEHVVTCGNGDLYQGSNADEEYTEIFNGTSSAAPMVAGVAAILQGIHRHYTGQNISPATMRDIIRNQELPRSFGHRPDLKKLILALEISSPVEVDQVDETGASLNNMIAKFESGNWQNHTVPKSFDLLLAEDVDFRADQSVISLSGPSRSLKFHHWNVEADGLIIQYNMFDIVPALENITAHFFEVVNATLELNLIDGNTQSGGTLEFKDPWLIDFNHAIFGLGNRGMDATFIDYESPFEIETDGDNQGVFLDQVPNPVNPNIPFYSVQAVDDQTIGGTTYYFDSWSGSGVDFGDRFAKTTTVIFRQADATVTANMKGHLTTGAADALTFNNQRKIVYDGSDYHLVYEDNEEIYYTYSDDDGATWAQEFRISDGGGGNKYPSIDVFLQMPVVVWQVKDGGSTGSIWMRRKTSGTWQTPQNVASLTGVSSNFKSTPVVTAQPNSYFFIAWQDFTFDDLRIRSYDPSGDELGDIRKIPSTNSNSQYPSLAQDRFGKLHLAWSESGKICYSKLRYFDDDDDYSADIDKEEVSSGTGYSNHVFPSITTDFDTRPNVMWEAYAGVALEKQLILHRRRESSGSWGSATVFSTNGSDFKPSIMSFPGISNNQKLRGVWGNEDNQLRIAKYDGSSWSNLSQGSGVDPTISANMSGDEKAQMVYRESGSAPHELTTTTNNLSKTTAGQFTHHRRGVLSLGQSEIAFEIGELEVDGEAVEFFPYVDTLVVNKTGQWEEMFITRPFTVSNQATLDYFRTFEILDRKALKDALPPGKKIEFRLEVVDAASGEILAVPDIQQVKKDVPPDKHDNKSLSFTLPGSREIFLRVGLALPEDVAIKQSLVEVFYENSESDPAKASVNPTPVELLPAVFELSQNYPNPFNPSTTIAFSLPQASPVTLSIYDINGRKVQTLVDNAVPAGNHEVVWDGRDKNGAEVSSGIYFYRIQAKNFVKEQKMILMR